jgi:hypothetical protein
MELESLFFVRRLNTKVSSLEYGDIKNIPLNLLNKNRPADGPEYDGDVFINQTIYPFESQCSIMKIRVKKIHLCVFRTFTMVVKRVNNMSGYEIPLIKCDTIDEDDHTSIIRLPSNFAVDKMDNHSLSGDQHLHSNYDHNHSLPGSVDLRANYDHNPSTKYHVLLYPNWLCYIRPTIKNNTPISPYEYDLIGNWGNQGKHLFNYYINASCREHGDPKSIRGINICSRRPIKLLSDAAERVDCKQNSGNGSNTHFSRRALRMHHSCSCCIIKTIWLCLKYHGVCQDMIRVIINMVGVFECLWLYDFRGSDIGDFFYRYHNDPNVLLLYEHEKSEFRRKGFQFTPGDQ